ncbi:MAG TPA: hypothetical protein VN577_05230 [Terriglobales bacterium]|nr:hypothetical protein [Terriglobales bacterium]
MDQTKLRRFGCVASRRIRGMGQMFRVGKNNPEYMSVLTGVVACLFNELQHPKLSHPTAKELTDWLHHVSLEEVQAALDRVLEQKEAKSNDAQSGT